MLNISEDSNGFKTAELLAASGGKVTIADYGAEHVSDIGFVSVVNGSGLGGSDWIRSVADIDRHVKDIEGTRWLTSVEQAACVHFLRSIAE